MPTTVLESFASALRSRAAEPASGDETHRAAVLLADQRHCLETASPIASEPVWSDSPVERAADAALATRQTDRDDVHWASLTHPGSVVWPIVSELGPAIGSSGPRRLAAALTGYAAIAALAAALGPEHGAIYHSTATAGTVGAAAATAVLIDLPGDRWPHALGHALSVLGGSRGAMLEYSGTRCFHSAHAIRTGIASTLAAARGLDATTADLDRRQGALAGLDPDRLTAGDHRALVESSLRVFPTSGWNQTAYEAALEAANRVRGRIDAVIIRTPAAAPPAVAEAVAAAIVSADGHRSPADLPALIELQPDAGVTAVRIDAAERSAESTVDVPLDHPRRPAAVAQLAVLKWHQAPAEAAERIARLTAQLAGEEIA
ncbi:MmgE/PrpD family protein [Microlunatus ginsengisoli]|uniref:MmgE/PrpD N-terminal domain-containing protein n=1 Tax=Microlunatus ginsengisoli TaxID=363863 RepID=A0ABP6ZVL9_9ACTN